MGKSIKVTLKKNQLVVTEAQYTIALALVKFDDSNSKSKVAGTVRMKTLRANSASEALGMAMTDFRKDTIFAEWNVANYSVLETGE